MHNQLSFTKKYIISYHSFDCEKSRQVGRVGGDEDEGEEPPGPAYDSAGNRPRRYVRALLHEGSQCKPETLKKLLRIRKVVKYRMRSCILIKIFFNESN